MRRVAALSLVLAACAHAPRTTSSAESSWEYVLDVPPTGSRVLRVEATFTSAASPLLVLPDDAAGVVHDLAVEAGGRWEPLAPSRGGWRAPACTTRCSVRYSMDLGELAASCEGGIDCARRIGRSTMTNASQWLVHPEGGGDATATLRVRGGDSTRFATGLRRAPGATDEYVWRAWQLDEGSYTAFGGLRHAPVGAPGAEVDAVILDAPLAMSDAEVGRWVTDATGAVARGYGRFPVDATVFLVPVRGEDHPVFGRVFSLAGASVAVLVGDRTRAGTVHDDWIMVHELFHTGFPSLPYEGHWLEEGLATYYEPLLRTRAGWMKPEELWQHFVEEMPRGVRPPDSPPRIEDRDDIDSTYWGGALFCFLVDTRLRQETKGARSLDDVLHAFTARGVNATMAWRLPDVVRFADEVTGTRVMSEVFASYAEEGEHVDLAAEWARLGVVTDAGGHARLVPGAPLAAVRDALTHP
jgi:hypothetical protein